MVEKITLAEAMERAIAKCCKADAEVIAREWPKVQRNAATFEVESNQYYTETLLLRAECIRLRENLCELASFIENTWVGVCEIPEEIARAKDAVFPPGPEAIMLRKAARHFADEAYAYSSTTVEGQAARDSFQIACEYCEELADQVEGNR